MIGRTLSHFSITAKLGEGGMGEVYRAEDTKLGREVAIKVLPEAVTADPERLARFEREAKVLASLNHPNIAGIHQIEEADGQVLLVMELVEGEDLAGRMDRGAVPVEEAVGIAVQVSQGLEGAHERGIVHRDLKPANIKVTADEQVKILDFGLAKAHEASVESSPDATRSPTLTAQMTQAGVILGTAAYMSPEQARGQEADPRSDIWSLGVVLFEMLTGARLFAEPTVSDTLAAVLRADFDWETLPEETPRPLRRVLRRCLERDAKQRYHAAADLRIDLEEALVTEEPAPLPEVEAPSSSRLPWLIAAAAAVLAVLLAVFEWSPGEGQANGETRKRTVASLLPPADADFSLAGPALSLSSDGSRLAFVGRDAEGGGAIWVRSLGRDDAERIAGTDEAWAPFWSPDGRSLGFSQDGRLKTLELETGLVEDLAPNAADGASWGHGGYIVYGDANRSGLWAVKETGGESRPVSEADLGDDNDFGPAFLPDGKHFIFFARRYGAEDQQGEVRLGSLDGAGSEFLFNSVSRASYVEPGFIVWWQQGNLRARRFDAEQLELVGEPFSIASNVRFDQGAAAPVMAISDRGTLVYQSGGRLAGNQLAWYDRQGEVIALVGEPGSLYSPQISPDDSRIALDISGDSNQGDIWVWDGERGSGNRVTAWPEDDSYPIWSPDNRELAFYSTRGGSAGDVFRIELAGGAEPELLLDGEGTTLMPAGWTPDGGTLLIIAGENATQDIWALSLHDGTVDKVIESAFAVGNPTTSPDGRWLAYNSNETGRREVYLANYPEADRRMRVSTDGGFGPVWSNDGAEIFYASPLADAVFAVSIAMDAGEPVLGRPVKLFSVDMRVHRVNQFHTIDGQRFLVNTDMNVGGRAPLTLVLNWDEGL